MDVPVGHLTAPTTDEEKASADKVLDEIHNLSVLAVRTELLVREHGRQLQEHREATERQQEHG